MMMVGSTGLFCSVTCRQWESANLLDLSVRPHCCDKHGENICGTYLASLKEVKEVLQNIIQSSDAGVLKVMHQVFVS